MFHSHRVKFSEDFGFPEQEYIQHSFSPSTVHSDPPKKKQKYSEKDEAYEQEHQSLRKLLEPTFNEIKSTINPTDPQINVDFQQKLQNTVKSLQTEWKEYLAKMIPFQSMLCSPNPVPMTQLSMELIYGRPVVNEGETRQFTFLNRQFVMPSQSTFLFSDLNEFDQCFPGTFYAAQHQFNHLI